MAPTTDEETELIGREVQAARRLVRLFRVERSGRFARRSAETVRRLVERRGQVIDELLRLDAQRRQVAHRKADELGLTMRVLAREVEAGELRCRELLARLDVELRQLHGDGALTGLRDGTGGRLLGHG
jgi:hypothetical protein